MANYRRTATGNWTNLAQWEDDSGGSYAASSVLPGPGDVVYANNFITTLDVDIVVDELRNDLATNINGGGRFVYGSGDTVVGNIFASSNANCLLQNTNTIKNLIGNITALVNQNTGVVINDSASGILNIIGNIIGGSSFQCMGVINGPGTVNVIGNVTGGSSNFCAGIRNNTTGFVNVLGIAEGGSFQNNPGVWNNQNGTTRVTTLKASNQSYAGTHTNTINPTGFIIVDNIEYASNGNSPSNVPILFSDTANKYVTVQTETQGSLTLIDPATTDIPTETDVRDGVSYASGGLTGTLKVPPSSSVAVGVPVDNTTGTAMISISDMGTLLTSFKIS
jgi:hypothetical protein